MAPLEIEFGPPVNRKVVIEDSNKPSDVGRNLGIFYPLRVACTGEFASIGHRSLSLKKAIGLMGDKKTGEAIIRSPVKLPDGDWVETRIQITARLTSSE